MIIICKGKCSMKVVKYIVLILPELLYIYIFDKERVSKPKTDSKIKDDEDSFERQIKEDGC